MRSPGQKLDGNQNSKYCFKSTDFSSGGPQPILHSNEEFIGLNHPRADTEKHLLELSVKMRGLPPSSPLNSDGPAHLAINNSDIDAVIEIVAPSIKSSSYKTPCVQQKYFFKSLADKKYPSTRLHLFLERKSIEVLPPFFEEQAFFC